MEKVLCVGVGNISRSPMMQAVLQQHLGDGFIVESAGVSQALAGRPANHRSVACLKERGVDLSGHVSRWIGDLDLGAYRWIVCVGHDEADTVRSALGAGAARVLVANEHRGGIPDPYELGLRGYLDCLALLDQVMPQVAQRIRGADAASTQIAVSDTSSMFHASSRALQDRFDTRRIADRIENRLVKDEIDDGSRRFIESVDMFFLATADEQGRPNCSYKGGAPGFVRVVDARTVAFPSYDGNGMYLSMGNVGRNPHVGLLFIDFERATRLRLNGTASLDERDPLMGEYPEAQFIVRVRVREIFPNCPRYIHSLRRVEASAFVPRAGCETPVPAWKRSEWARDAVPEKDPARDPSRSAK